MKRILLTGATGFIGGHVLRRASPELEVDVRVVVRDPSRLPPETRAEVVVGDIRDRNTVRRALDGVDILVHAAAYLGSDVGEQTSVNIDGTREVMRAATVAGVSRIVSISTASIYGSGPFRGQRPEELEASPESPLSWSRLGSESLVRDAGGFVIRPHLVYGKGDRRVLPAILRFTGALKAFIDGGTARVSVIRGDQLADLVVKLAVLSDHRLPSAILHAASPLPPTVAQILAECQRALRSPLPSSSISATAAIRRAAQFGVSAHQASMIAVDGWFDAADLWRIGKLPMNTSFELDAESTDWYSPILNGKEG